MAARLLLNKRVKRIILARPAVEAGEKLGFLPGDLAEKVNPYLRPLYDAMHDMMDFEKVEQLRERGQIEVAPLAFMRGRTPNDSFVILDEAQNATSEQMRMFLTRLRLREQGGRHGRRDPDRSPAGRAQRPARGAPAARATSRASRSASSRMPTWFVIRWFRRSSACLRATRSDGRRPPRALATPRTATDMLEGRPRAGPRGTLMTIEMPSTSADLRKLSPRANGGRSREQARARPRREPAPLRGQRLASSPRCS